MHSCSRTERPASRFVQLHIKGLKAVSLCWPLVRRLTLSLPLHRFRDRVLSQMCSYRHNNASLYFIFQTTLDSSFLDTSNWFLQFGSGERDVQVGLPCECMKKGFYWLLFTTAYGLVNANAKRQDRSDFFLRDLGFVQLVHAPQLLFEMVNHRLHSLCSAVTLCTVLRLTADAGPRSPPLTRVSYVCPSKTFANVLDEL